MSEFFAPPPPPPVPEHEPQPRPPWMGAPDGTLPGAVALELVLARNDRAAVALTRLGAYPTGFTLDLLVFTVDDELDPALFGPRSRGAGPSTPAEIFPELMQRAPGGRMHLRPSVALRTGKQS